MRRPRLQRPRLRRRKADAGPDSAAGEAAKPAKAGKRRGAAAKAGSETAEGGKGPRLGRLRRSSRGGARKDKRARRKRGEPRTRIGRLAGELWFRFRTRIRAVGYWAREKAQIGGRVLAAVAGFVAGLWLNRSRGAKTRIVAVAAVLALYSVIKFTALPGVPCGLSEVKECPPGDDAVALVPADALLYAHLTLERDSEQFERAGEYAERLPNLLALVDDLAVTIPTASGNRVEGGSEVLAWADRDFAVALLPGEKKGSQAPVFIGGVGDKAAAEAFVEKVAPAGEPAASEQDGAPLTVYSSGFAAAFIGDQLAFGDEQAVRRVLDTSRGREADLDGGASGVIDELPDLRFAEVYLSRPGVRRLLAGGAGGATQLETFINYRATAAMAVSASARDDGVEVEIISKQDPKLAKRNPSFLTSLPEFEPGLASEAGSRAFVYLGLGRLGDSLGSLLSARGGQAAGLVDALNAFSKRLRAESQVDLLGELLPSLQGEAALVVEPTDTVPFASLIVDEVDSEKASKSLIALQNPVLRAIGTDAASGIIPRFEEVEVEGVTASTVRLSPAIELTYALFDDKLVLSTSPDGVAAVRAEGGGLGGSDAYEKATERLPDQASALLFLNLDELLGLAEGAGLAEDPLYASLRDDIATVGAIGLTVSARDDELRSDLFLAIDEPDNP